jgi:flagella basal body P-ring formation protein FlgA
MSFALALLAATPFVDLAAVDRAVTDFAGATALPLDRRLRLAPCSSPLALSWRTPRRETVVVECPVAGGWRLFVPVAAGADMAPVAINRGDAVTVAVSGQSFNVSQPGEALESGPVGGWVRVKTAGGQPMRAQIVRPGLVSVPLP